LIDAATTPAPKTKKKHGCLVSLGLLFVFFIVLSLFVEFAAPIMIQSLAADQIQQSLKLREKPEVAISVHPLLYKLIIGRIDSVSVKAVNIDAKEGYTVDSVDVQIKGIKFNTLRLLKTRQPAIEGIDEGQIRVVLSEKAVNVLVAGQLPGAKVKLVKDRMKYTGDLPYVLPGFSFTVPGTVSVLPDNTLAFNPVPEEIQNLPVPQEIKDYLADALAIKYRVLELPEGVTMTTAKVTPGKLTIDASIDTLDNLVQSVAGGA
jgi:hypothetical protein